jgi:aromatic ring hydroxylase
MSKKGRATLRDIVGYIRHGPSYFFRLKEAEQITIPGTKELIIKIDPSLASANRQSSKELGEILFEKLHSRLTNGVYNAHEESVVANFFQNYQVNELRDIRDMVKTWGDPSGRLGYKTPDFYGIISNVINSLEKKAQANPSGEKKYHDLSCGETEERVHSALHGVGKASFDRLQEESESDDPLRDGNLEKELHGP